MTVRLLLSATVALACCNSLAQEAQTLPCQPWATQYAGDHATGPHVIGLWQFNADAETDDASPSKHALVLEGATISPQGRFGSCLETAPGWPVEDKRHRAMVKDHPSLSPQGAFSLELWLRPKPELDADYPDAFLLDKKYVAHDDYQLILGPAAKNGTRTLRACLGFGAESSTWHSRPAVFEPDRWVHVAFVYDGAGTGSFFLDGRPWGSRRIDGRKSISPGGHGLSIGDRVGSYYHGFPGLIDQVRICRGALEFRRAALVWETSRRCFVRMETPPASRMILHNLQTSPLGPGTLSVGIGETTLQQTTFAALGPQESLAIDCPLDTSIRPGKYTLTVRLDVETPEPFTSEERFSVQIVPRKPPHQMPVLMWGIHGSVADEIERLQRIGFTHVLGIGADYTKIFGAGGPTRAAAPEVVDRARQSLDMALAADLTLVASLSPGAAMRKNETFRRVDRKGEAYTGREDICGLFPELEKYCYNVGASVAETYGDHPALGAAMVHTEVRGHARPCFHEHDRKAFAEHAGFEIPPEVVGPRGVDYTRLADFPESRVIADDHPLYVYYRWYWKEGDGWNRLNSALHRGLKSTGRDDLWTYHDPAVRVASVYGSGGAVDVLSQWTYSYPDPIRIGLATDELLAMTGGSDSQQQVMKMTQVIWYRSQTAPEPKTPADALPYRASWEIEQPDAPFITIPPMHLREAFWTKIARPIRGIMYHGWQSLVSCEPPGGYRFTHPQTQHELARLVRQVVRPLGPTLLQIPGTKSDVAFLESFVSEMFARRGTYGWCGSWAGDAYHVLLYAHLQPEIVFDETIAERGLDGFKVLVMTDCDVITEAMAERIETFQKRGGLVIGDERLTPAVKPDITLEVYQRTGRADADKAALLDRAASLRRQLDARYSRYVDTDSPEVISYRRRHGQTDYVFLVNDRREYGQYVGQHGIVMENGLPSTARVTVDRTSGHVYDLVAARKVDSRSDNGQLTFDLEVGPCDGTVLMVTDQPIARVRIAAPEEAERSTRVDLTIEVLDSDGQPVQAVVPLEVTVRDAEGRIAEFSGHYAAVDGRASISLDIASNDPPGIWQVEARELASGRTAMHYLRVAGPEPWPPQKGPLPESVADPVQPKG